MAKKALHTVPGVDHAPSINPKLRAKGRPRRSASELAEGILKGQVAELAQGITLVESLAPADRADAAELLQLLLPHSGGAFRIGITGVPGVGKSTFLEHYGLHLLARDSEARVAVLAVDPSSAKTKGSILGDKTRMVELGQHERAFIRPSASGGSLGGVARATKEAMLLCEAAGYTHVLVETVGVGQSETVVAQLVDAFLFLAMPGTGDELQGIKKGIMEMADLIGINKSEGEQRPRAERSAQDIRRALQLFSVKDFDWIPPVVLLSALESLGFEDLDEALDRFQRHSRAQGWFAQKRKLQDRYWFERSVREGVFQALEGQNWWRDAEKSLAEQVANGDLSPFAASALLIEQLVKNQKV